jgi:hypothetical protein
MNKYYVYIHKRKDTGVVFYLGKGCRNRAYAKHNFKSKDWQEIDSISGHNVEFIATNLTEKQALRLEKFLLEHPDKDWNLVNKHIFSKVNYSINFHDLFEYNETSPSCLVWKIKPFTFGKFKIEIGDKVGSQSKTTKGTPKSWDTNISGIKYKIHRIIWVMHYGEIDDSLLIDHVDGNPFNNKIENLRLVTYKENSLNKIIHRKS